MVKIMKLFLFLMSYILLIHLVSDPDPIPRGTDPDPAKSFGSLRIRIHNTGRGHDYEGDEG
jgi:hypothetical protein